MKNANIQASNPTQLALCTHHQASHIRRVARTQYKHTSTSKQRNQQMDQYMEFQSNQDKQEK